jgi:hypothetical protein
MSSLMPPATYLGGPTQNNDVPVWDNVRVICSQVRHNEGSQMKKIMPGTQGCNKLR